MPLQEAPLHAVSIASPVSKQFCSVTIALVSAPLSLPSLRLFLSGMSFRRPDLGKAAATSLHGRHPAVKGEGGSWILGAVMGLSRRRCLHHRSLTGRLDGPSSMFG